MQQSIHVELGCRGQVSVGHAGTIFQAGLMPR